MPNPIKNNGKEAGEALSKFLGDAGFAGAAAGKAGAAIGKAGGKEAAQEQIQSIMRNGGGEAGAKNNNKEDGDVPELPGGSLQMNNDALKMSPYRNEHALKMESAKQEKYNLMHDNPVDKDASGGRDVSWMSKHVTKLGGSPIKKHCI